jgi:dTDP-4-dehydrorhamnose reductase
MKILITGANGLLGTYLLRELHGAGHQLLATGLGEERFRIADPALRGTGFGLQNENRGSLTRQAEWALLYQSLDIRDAEAVRETILSWKPAWILHNAAWAQPDQCETDPVGCWAVNVTATRFLIDAAREIGASFLYMSTDFVFDGLSGPYREEDAVGPVNYYGCSKRVAEKAVMESDLQWAIVRTVLVYGQSPTVQRFNLLTWVRDKLLAGERIRVVGDQFRTPTYAGDLAKGVRLVMEKNETGIFHISGREFMTPYDMAVSAAKALDLDHTLIERVDASTFTQPARRPPRTGFVIDKAIRLLGYEPLPFREGLLQMLQQDPS